LVSGHAHIPVNTAGTALLYVAVDSDADVAGDLAQYRSSLVAGGVAILSSSHGAGVSRVAAAALTDFTGNTIEGAGTVIYGRKRV
jgi:hypothetical protein